MVVSYYVTQFVENRKYLMILALNRIHSYILRKEIHKNYRDYLYLLLLALRKDYFYSSH